MSVTTKEAPCNVECAGGLPTAEEFWSVSNALGDVDEHGLSPLLQRLAEPYIAAYEEGRAADWTYEDIGLLATHIDLIVHDCEHLLSKARRIEELRKVYAEAMWTHENKLEEMPPCGKYGGEYQPSHDALVRWGLVDAS